MQDIGGLGYFQATAWGLSSGDTICTTSDMVHLWGRFLRISRHGEEAAALGYLQLLCHCVFSHLDMRPPHLIASLLALLSSLSRAWQRPHDDALPDQQPLAPPDLTLASSFTASDETLATGPITTTARDGGDTPKDHWKPPDRYDPYICECLGENSCWSPKFTEDDGTGAPYSHDGVWPARKHKCIIPSLPQRPREGRRPRHPRRLRRVPGRRPRRSCSRTRHTTSTPSSTPRVSATSASRSSARTLRWGTDIAYWLSHSLPVGFSEPDGCVVRGCGFFGHGGGTLDGSGQVRYVGAGGRWRDLSQQTRVVVGRCRGSMDLPFGRQALETLPMSRQFLTGLKGRGRADI